MDEHDHAPIPVALYGATPLLCPVSWYVLQATIVQTQGLSSPLREALGRDLKGKLSRVEVSDNPLMMRVTRPMRCRSAVVRSDRLHSG
jgi:hypothetical protein